MTTTTSTPLEADRAALRLWLSWQRSGVAPWLTMAEARAVVARRRGTPQNLKKPEKT